MKAGLRIIVFGLMAVLFMSTSGMAVYKHYCSQNELAKSYFVINDDNCDMSQMAEENREFNCCHNELDEEVQMHEDCCSHNMEFYQINSNLINHEFKSEIAKVHLSTSINGLVLVTNELDQENTAVVPVPPPHIKPRQRLSLYQTYLI